MPTCVSKQSNLPANEFTREVEDIVTSLRVHAGVNLQRVHGIKNPQDFAQWAWKPIRLSSSRRSASTTNRAAPSAYDSLVARYKPLLVADPTSRGYQTRVNKQGATEIFVNGMGWLGLRAAKYAGLHLRRGQCEQKPFYYRTRAARSNTDTLAPADVLRLQADILSGKMFNARGIAN